MRSVWFFFLFCLFDYDLFQLNERENETFNDRMSTKKKQNQQSFFFSLSLPSMSNLDDDRELICSLSLQ